MSLLQSTMVFKGALMIPIEITPRPQNLLGCVAIDNIHCSLMLPRLFKPLKEAHDISNKQLKVLMEKFVESHPAPPMLYLGSVHKATRTNLGALFEDTAFYKTTYFIEVKNQQEMQTYLDTVTDALGLDRSERYFHVSIANETGKATDSIGDTCIDDTTKNKEE